MSHTVLILIVLVFACLWYTGRRPVSQLGVKGQLPLAGPKVYAALVGFALIAAYLWR
jgi:hypothetical protein